MTDILERLRHSVVTATNDDLSEVRTDKRDRHIERLTAMQDASAEIEALRAGFVQIAAVCDDNASVGNTALALKFVREVAGKFIA